MPELDQAAQATGDASHAPKESGPPPAAISHASALQKRVMQRKADTKLGAAAAAAAAAGPEHEEDEGEAEEGGAEHKPSAGGGRPLPSDLKAHFEAAFKADFSAVRVHEDGKAGGVGAHAYAQGNDLHFAPGQYDPGSLKGKELIGHELTHIVQQRAGRVAAPQGKGKGAAINEDEGLEHEADEQGAKAAGGHAANVGGATKASGGSAGGTMQAKLAWTRATLTSAGVVKGFFRDKKGGGTTYEAILAKLDEYQDNAFLAEGHPILTGIAGEIVALCNQYTNSGKHLEGNAKEAGRLKAIKDLHTAAMIEYNAPPTAASGARRAAAGNLTPVQAPAPGRPQAPPAPSSASADVKADAPAPAHADVKLDAKTDAKDAHADAAIDNHDNVPVMTMAPGGLPKAPALPPRRPLPPPPPVAVSEIDHKAAPGVAALRAQLGGAIGGPRPVQKPTAPAPAPTSEVKREAQQGVQPGAALPQMSASKNGISEFQQAFMTSFERVEEISDPLVQATARGVLHQLKMTIEAAVPDPNAGFDIQKVIGVREMAKVLDILTDIQKGDAGVAALRLKFGIKPEESEADEEEHEEQSDAKVDGGGGPEAKGPPKKKTYLERQREHLDELDDAVDHMDEKKRSEIASSTMTQRKIGNYAKLAVKTGASTALGLVPGAGNVFNVAMAVKAARSSHEHAKKIRKIRQDMIDGGRHDEFSPLATTAAYTADQKERKRNKNIYDAGASAVPVAGTVAKGAKTAFYKIKGIVKAATGKRGVERNENAKVLVTEARGGDKDARMILLQLFSNERDEYIACLHGAQPAAVEMVAKKLASG